MYDEIKISVIIVNYNVKYFLEQCLLSVRAAANGMDVEVFVVDNQSTDGSVAYLRPAFPEVTFIENRDNVGFATANNHAIARCKGEYVLLLNPDTVIGEESLRTLSFFMDEHPEAGGVGVKMIDGHGVFLPESKRSFPSPWVSFCKLFGLSGLFPKSKIFDRYRLSYLSPNKEHPVDVLAGAFMLLRHEALDRVGLLDEAFFMYGEDIDLSYRLVLAGYQNYYVPERMLHYKGESTRHGEINYVKTFYGAMHIFYKKYYAHSGWLISLLINIAIGFRASIAGLSRLLGFSRRKKRAIKRRRLLILCKEGTFEKAKAACVEQMPELEHVNLWDLNEERVMEAICRRNQMKGFTDIAFCYPEIRFEQMLLFMDTMVNKTTTYHIYNKVNEQVVSSAKQV
ncbi:MAG: glycosyltransferase family 2 protein [Tannerellaceae bacterium]|jgi:GT2 family glycosyltransferase|nr:glycosyltransferase family 2 protein [Tannerellaceae bacterium]